MLPFTKKELSPPKRICLRLREARKAACISAEEVAEKTRMSMRVIAALEECRFHDLPFSSLYQKHLIQSYARAIGMNPEAFLNQFEQDELWRKKSRQPLATRPKSLTRFMSVPLLLRAGVTVAAALLCLGYLGFQVQRILKPPSLMVYTPVQGDILRSSTLVVAGKTDPEVQVTLNGAPVSQNNSGEFSATLDLPTGVNTLVIAAKKKHGKITTDVRHVIVREETQFSFTSPDATSETL